MNEQLTTKQNKTIEALLLTNTIDRAAKRANVSEASIYRWMKQESFQTALRAARRDILAHTTTRPPANERSRPRHARERDGRPESLLCQPSQRLALGHGNDVPRRRHRRHHRTTQNRRRETVEPPEWMTSSRKPGKQLQSRARKPAVKRAEACGQAPGSPRSSARKPACQTCGNLRVKRAETSGRPHSRHREKRA